MFKFNKVMAMLMAVTLITLSLAGCVSTPAGSSAPSTGIASDSTVAPVKSDLHVAIVVPSTFGTQAFVDVALVGCQQAADDFGFKLSKIENCETANAVDILRPLAQSGINMFIMPNSAYADAILTLSGEFPEVHFVSADIIIPEKRANVTSVGYREHEAGFLAGAFTALMSKAGKVAFIGGTPGGTMDRFESGFLSGARYVKKDIDAVATYVGSYNDVAKGKEIANMLYKQGYDWLAPAAGASNMGIFQASKEMGDGYWSTGAADGQFHLMPDKIIASQVKTIDKVCYDIIKNEIEGTSTAGQQMSLGIAEGGVDLIFNPDAEVMKIVTKEVMDKLDEMRADVSSGKIVVPATAEELKNFTYPA